MSSFEFSIDDVRDSFAEDVEALLGRARAAAALAAAAPDAALPGLVDAEGERPTAVIAESAHALHGLTGQIGLGGMTRTAAAMGRLARAAFARVAGPAPDPEAYRTMLALAVGAADALSEMARLELQHRSAEADALGDAVIAEAQPWIDAAGPAADSTTGRVPIAPPETAGAPGESPTAVIRQVSAMLDEFDFAAVPEPTSAAPKPSAPGSPPVPPVPTVPTAPPSLGSITGSDDGIPAADFAEAASVAPRPPAPPVMPKPADDGDERFVFAEAVPVAGPADTSEPAALFAEPADSVADADGSATASLPAAVPVEPAEPLLFEPTAAGEFPTSEFTPLPGGGGVPAPPRSADAEGLPEGVDAELLDIFRQEAREALVAAPGRLSRLAADPSDRESADALARAFHTLKGGSAMVGLASASATAKGLEETFEEVAEGRRRADPAFLADAVARANALVTQLGLGLPPLPVPAAPSPANRSGVFTAVPGEPLPAEASDDLRALFLSEVAEIVRSAEAALNSFADPSAIRGELSRLLHRLKGSATVYSDRDLAGRAERLRRACESPGAVPETTFAEVRGFLASLRELPGVAAALAAPPPADDAGTVLPASPEDSVAVDAAAGRAAEAVLASESMESMSDSGPFGSPMLSPYPGAAPEGGVSSFDFAEPEAAEPAGAVPAAGTPIIAPPADGPATGLFAPTGGRSSRDIGKPPPGFVREAVDLDMDAELAEAFAAECTETLDALERAILALPEHPQPKTVLSELLRHYHTLKGAVNSVGVAPVGRILHRLEDLMEDLAESAVLPPMRRLSRMLLRRQDLLRANLRQAERGFVDTDPDGLDAEIAAVLSGEAAERKTPGRSAASAESAESAAERSRGSDASQESQGSQGSQDSQGSREAEADAERSAGSQPSGPSAASPSGPSAASAAVSGVSGLSGMSGRSARGEADAPQRQFVRVAAERLEGLMNRSGELVITRTRMTHRVKGLQRLQRELEARTRALAAAVEEFRRNNEFTLIKQASRRPGGAAGAAGAAGSASATVSTAETADPLTPVPPVAADPAAPASPAPAAASSGTATPTGPAAGGAVPALFGALELDTYDDINILSRKLAEIGSDINELQQQIDDGLELLDEDAETLGRTVGELQDDLTRARMVTVDQLFTRLRRPVADAAERLDKSVRTVTFGEDVDLDRTIVDRLYLPMVHLVRNCVAHGIEKPEARRAAGKDPVGTVTLTAEAQGGSVVVEVSDDGAGLDLAALRRKAERLGLLRPGFTYGPEDIAELIFTEGMSTAGSVGDVSGRGMGGAIIRKEIQALGGQIRVRSVAGRGTTFVITLPLTLAIRRALVVGQSGESFAVPLQFAERSINLAEYPVVESAGVARVRVGDEYIPLLSLAGALGLPETSAPAGGDEAGGPGGGAAGGSGGSRPAVVLILGGQRAALRVDRVVGQQEIVVKSLGELLDGHPLFSAATLGPEGEVVLILDVAGVLEAGSRASASGLPVAAAAATATATKSAAAKGKAATPSAPSAPAAAGAAAGRRRVMFVDDSLSVRKVGESFLSRMGYDVTVAVDGRDALTKLTAGTFDFVFTDLEMPRMNGFELLREIRRTPALAALPVVVVTSRSADKHRRLAELSGATGYLTKPFTAENLGDMLKRHLAKATAGA